MIKFDDPSEVTLKIDRFVDRAVALIGPPRVRRDECRGVVKDEIADFEVPFWDEYQTRYPRTKAAKRAAARLRDVLKRVEVVLNDKRLDEYITLYFPRDELTKWKNICDEQAKLPSEKKPKQMKAERKRRAVSLALFLIQSYAADGAWRRIDTRSAFCQLAALLYDGPHFGWHSGPDADLRNQCREALRKKRGQK